MHYWQLHIGDWSKSCGHLTPSETGLYVRMLNVYYDSEKPLPADTNAVCRLVGARTPRERDEICDLLTEFFDLENDGWHNKRADSEINRLRDIGEKRSAASAKRWKSNCNPSAMQLDTKCNALQDSKTPRLQEEDSRPSDSSATAPKRPAKPHPPYQAMADLYGEVCGDVFGQRVAKLTDARKRAIAKAWRFDLDNPDQDLRTDSLDYWRRYFTACTRRGFFARAAAGDAKGEHAGWRPGFDFLIRQDTWLGMREGKYQ